MFEFLKHKQTAIGYGMLLPAFLVLVQAAAYVYFPPVPANGSGRPIAADKVPPNGTVLGASTDLRSRAPAAAMPTPPVLSVDELARISAKSFLVYDKSGGGQILAERQGHLKLGIASLTKLMTGLLAYEYLDFAKPIAIDKTGLTAVRPIVNFSAGDEVLAGDVFDAMIVGSCNDAAQVLARAVENASDKKIVDLMNQKAQDLGMIDTSFANPVGFDNVGNYSTATDLEKLITETQTLAAFANLGKTAAVDFSGSAGINYEVPATNTLLKHHSDLLAIKTGFTAGSQGAMATKVLENNHEIIILVLGSADREQDTLTLKQLVADRLSW